MKRQDYANRHRADDARYDLNRAVARAHLDLAAALVHRRESLGYSVELAAERSGISPDRLELIEEGDTTSLGEVLRLCRGLDLILTVDNHLAVRVAPVSDQQMVATR